MVILSSKISFSPKKTSLPERSSPEELICTEKTEKSKMKNQSQNSQEEAKITSLYGLDLDLLRSLNMGDLIEEQTRQLQQPQPSKPQNDHANLTIDQMRQTFGQFPQKQGRRRLRDVV